jgi:ankyrin repeat protein
VEHGAHALILHYPLRAPPTQVSLLIEFGADYNKPDADGALPIMRAAFLGHEAVTKVLLREPRDFEVRCARTQWRAKWGL